MSTKEKILIEDNTSIKPPRKWKVKFYNDNFTPYDFVIVILIEFFGYSPINATNTAIKINDTGESIVGEYPKSIAISKAKEVITVADEAGFPLRVEAVQG